MLVELKGLGKSHIAEDVETRALRNIDLQIDRGEYVAIEGPSGCGKSTLLSILGLLDRQTVGTYALGGRAMNELGAAERAAIRSREIGFVFQNFNLIGNLSIHENVELPLVYQRIPKSERMARVNAALDRVKVSHRAKHYPMHLSGGEQQRAAVARAIISEPSILLADEPTGNLDTRNGEAVMALLTRLNEAGSTIIMVTHDSRFARQATRTVGLLDGQLHQ